MLDTNPLFKKMICKCFLPICGLSSYFLSNVFQKTEALNLDGSLVYWGFFFPLLIFHYVFDFESEELLANPK